MDNISLMNEKLNMPLRSKVLEMALVIEECMSNILLTFLVIDKTDTRTLSNRSSSLSFKQKIDLLFNLDILTKEENSKLLLLMEFRNQFLHNASCNSFEAAINAIDGSKSKLLKLDDLTYDAGMEFRLENAYSALHLACMDIVLAKYAKRQEQVEARRKFVSDIVSYGSIVMDSDSELILKIMNRCLPNHSDTPQEISLKMTIVEMIDSHTNELECNQELKDLKDAMSQCMEPDQLKIFFTR